MYYTHHFASQQTLDRARSWLLELGFPATSIEAHAAGIPRISVAVDAARLSEVELLIDSLELSDPQGWPGLWETAHQVPVHRPFAMDVDGPPPRTSVTTAIGWHPDEAPLGTAPDHDGIAEAMSRRWGWT